MRRRRPSGPVQPHVMIATVPDATSIQLHLAGLPRLVVQGHDHVLEGLSALLAARLALDGPQPRAGLAAWLWPDTDAARARANLRQRLLRLRQQSGVEWLGGDPHLALAPQVTVAPVDEPGAAELLLGVALKDPDEPAAWLDRARQQQRQRLLAAWQARAQEAQAEQRWPDALHAVQQQLALDPLSEAVHRQRVRLHYLAHDLPRARAAADELQALLQRHFGAAPSGETAELLQLVRAASLGPSHRVAAAVPRALALLRPPRLVGRQRELAALREAVATSRPLLLLGEAGMGKSRLLAEALHGSDDALVVKAQVGDADVPYATLSRLLRRVFELPGATPRPGVLAHLLPDLPLGPPAPASGQRLALQEAVQQALAATRLRVVALDDLHFTDAATLELLPSLVDADASPLAWLFTLRPGEGAAAIATWRDALEDGAGLATHAVAALDPGQVHELLQDLAPDLQLPAAQASVLAPALHRHTGGNPLFVLETLKSLQPGTDGLARLPQPSGVAALIDRRLRRLTAPALALARVAAIAGPDFDPALAEAVTGRPALELADAWAELEHAQVLRDSAFAHDLVLDAALRSVPAAIAARLHAAVAQQLQSRPPAPGRAARLAAHWQAAGDGRAAWPWLLQAADEARDTLRRGEEADFVEQAARLVQQLQPHAAPAPTSLWVRAYLARECVGGLPAALPALDEALHAATDAHQRLDVQVMRAAALVDACDYEQGLAAGLPALQQALALGDDARAATVLTKVGSALAMTGRAEEAAALLERHWPVVERLPVPVPANHTERGLLLDNLGRPHEARPLHRRCIELAMQRGLHSEQVIGRLNLAVSLLDTGEAAAALVELHAAERLRLAHDGLDGAGVTGWNLLALAERDLAHPTAALGWFERQLQLDARQLPVRTALDRLNRAWLWAHMGQPARALHDLSDDAGYAELPAWVAARAVHLRLRLAQQRGAVDARLLKVAQDRLSDAAGARPVHDALQIELALVRCGQPGADAGGCAEVLESICHAAQRDGYHGVQAAATWAAARCAAWRGDRAGARERLRQALARPDAHVPADLWPGTWWHGLWQVACAVGDADAAQAARAEGVAWIHRMLQHDLAPEFRAAFRDALPAHRDLLVAR